MATEERRAFASAVREPWPARSAWRLEKKTAADRIAVCSMNIRRPWNLSRDRLGGERAQHALQRRGHILGMTRHPLRLPVERRLELGIGHCRFLVEVRVVATARFGVRQHLVGRMNQTYETAQILLRIGRAITETLEQLCIRRFDARRARARWQFQVVVIRVIHGCLLVFAPRCSAEGHRIQSSNRAKRLHKSAGQPYFIVIAVLYSFPPQDSAAMYRTESAGARKRATQFLPDQTTARGAGPVGGGNAASRRAEVASSSFNSAAARFART